MSQFDRPTEPEDYVRDAIVAFVLMRCHDHSHGSIRDDRLEAAVLLLLDLLELKGVSLEGIFYKDDDSRKLAVSNALSRMNIEGATFSKISNDHRHYFEYEFPRWADRVIKNDLPEEIHEACLEIVDVTIPVLAFGDNPERILEEWRHKLEMSSPATS